MSILEYTASGNILLFCNFFVVHFQEVIHQQSFTVTLGQLFQVLSIVLLVLHRLSAVASNYCLGLHILSGRLRGTSVSAKQEYRRVLHNFQRYRWNGKIPSPQPLPARVEDVG